MSALRRLNKKEELGLLSYFGFSRASLTLLWLLSGQGQTVHPVLEPPRSVALGETSWLLFSSPLRRANMPRVPPAPEGLQKDLTWARVVTPGVEDHLWEHLHPEELSPDTPPPHQVWAFLPAWHQP